MGKLFTSVLNNRLSTFLEDNVILSENQAGFRKGYATTDHIFSLYALKEILKSQKKKLFCVFIDFSQAFDSVWRVGLWQKLLNTGVNGKFFLTLSITSTNISNHASMLTKHIRRSLQVTAVYVKEKIFPLYFSQYSSMIWKIIL